MEEKNKIGVKEGERYRELKKFVLFTLFFGKLNKLPFREITFKKVPPEENK